MLLLCLSMVWAKGMQSFVYKVLQNGAQVGHRNVVITYLPSTKKQPDGATKVEIESDVTLNIAGRSVRYQQKGIGVFSKRRSNFVVSNNVDGMLTEFQGRRSISGLWTVHSIYEGSFTKLEYSPLQVQDISMELFIPDQKMENDPFDCMIIDGTEIIVQNSVWKKINPQGFLGIDKDNIEESLGILVGIDNINSVWNKDGYLLGANINILGMRFSMILEDIPKERYFGDVNEKNDFQGIQEEEL